MYVGRRAIEGRRWARTLDPLGERPFEAEVRERLRRLLLIVVPVAHTSIVTLDPTGPPRTAPSTDSASSFHRVGPPERDWLICTRPSSWATHRLAPGICRGAVGNASRPASLALT